MEGAEAGAKRPSLWRSLYALTVSVYSYQTVAAIFCFLRQTLPLLVFLRRDFKLLDPGDVSELASS